MTRSKGEGTIGQRKDGRWQARLRLPDGSRRSLYGKTKREALRKLTEARYDAARDLLPPDERMTVQDALDTWLANKTRQNLKPGTLERYRAVARIHLASLGRMKLKSLHAEHLEKLYDEKLQAGLSTTTINHIHLVIQGALATAVKRGYVHRNVAKLVEGKPGVKHKERVPFTEAEIRTFMDAVKAHRLAAFFQLALTTGMREAEILGLSWDDIDWGRAEVHVHRQLKHGHETEGDTRHFYLDTLKTEKSRRIVPIAAPMVEALRQQQERQRFERHGNPLNLIFVTRNGHPIDANNLRKRQYYRLLKDTGLRQITLHALRHSFATAMRRDTNDKHVSDFLGHSSVDTTDVYTHLTDDVKQAMVERIEKLFWA